MKYESMILCPDSTAGYFALHEAVQDGWEPLLRWANDDVNHILLRRPVRWYSMFLRFLQDRQ